MNRKVFLKTLFFSCAAGLGTVFIAGCKETKNIKDIIHHFFGKDELNPEDQISEGQKEKLLELCRDFYSPKSNYRKIAQEYLEKFSNERTLNALINLIYSKREFKRLKKNASLRKALARKISYDFKKNNVLYINNWLLSKTEIRIAAVQYKLEG